jgi:transcriptional regulator with GAF, ATPase, and Fis domain
MDALAFEFYDALFGQLEVEELERRFLSILLKLQHVERGSIWVRSEGHYICLEAAGREFEKIKGMRLAVDRPSVVGWVIENSSRTVAEPGKDQRHCKEIEEGLTEKSTLILGFPMILKDGRVYGAVEIIDTQAGGNRLNLHPEYLELLQRLVDIGSIALSHALDYADQVQENRRLKATLEAMRKEGAIIGESAAFRQALKTARDYARTDFPVLVTGESGTGKEVLALEVHRVSRRKNGAFLVQNCSAIPETLLESELFGYRKGAFTGAVKDKLGLFEAANGGTVFLDEIGDMPLHLQARILRVIENGEVKPLGGTETRSVDVRIVSATNQDLASAIAEGTFREDLYYRLNVLPLVLPPLRERREDIPLLLDYFVKRESLRLSTPPKSFSPAALGCLTEAHWGGNIRELQNFVKYVLATVPGERVELEHLPPQLRERGSFLPAPCPAVPAAPALRAAPQPAPAAAMDVSRLTWDEMEREYVVRLLEGVKWNVSKAARAAGVNRSTFDSRMKRLGIQKE